MYKCKICNRTYSVKNDYCECGSNDFEIIEPKKKPVAVKTPEQHAKEIGSWAIFIGCVIAAVVILFI